MALPRVSLQDLLPIYGPRLNHLTLRRLREQYDWDALIANNKDIILMVRRRPRNGVVRVVMVFRHYCIVMGTLLGTCPMVSLTVLLLLSSLSCQHHSPFARTT